MKKSETNDHISYINSEFAELDDCEYVQALLNTVADLAELLIAKRDLSA